MCSPASPSHTLPTSSPAVWMEEDDFPLLDLVKPTSKILFSKRVRDAEADDDDETLDRLLTPPYRRQSSYRRCGSGKRNKCTPLSKTPDVKSEVDTAPSPPLPVLATMSASPPFEVIDLTVDDDEDEDEDEDVKQKRTEEEEEEEKTREVEGTCRHCGETIWEGERYLTEGSEEEDYKMHMECALNPAHHYVICKQCNCVSGCFTTDMDGFDPAKHCYCGPCLDEQLQDLKE